MEEHDMMAYLLKNSNCKMVHYLYANWGWSDN